MPPTETSATETVLEKKARLEKEIEERQEIISGMEKETDAAKCIRALKFLSNQKRRLSIDTAHEGCITADIEQPEKDSHSFDTFMGWSYNHEGHSAGFSFDGNEFHISLTRSDSDLTFGIYKNGKNFATTKEMVDVFLKVMNDNDVVYDVEYLRKKQQSLQREFVELSATINLLQNGTKPDTKHTTDSNTP